MNKTLTRGLFACLSLAALASCQDHDFGYTTADVRKGLYAKDFEKAFGKVDPNQDWSMAAYVKAYVSGMEDGTLELLYSDPIAGKTVLIAKRPVVNGEADFNFNVVKGTNRIFARIKNAKGYYTLNRYFEIFDDEVYIANESTRAGGNTFTGTSRVTKESASTLDCPQLIDWTKSDNFYLEDAYKAAAEDYIDGYYADNTNRQSITGKAEFYHTGTFTNIYWLNDVISTADERPWWYVSEIAPFFSEVDGMPACFDEAVNHIKLMKEGSNPKLEKDLVFEIGEGGGPFYLDYFFEGTDFVNDFGYFYVTKEQTFPTRETFMSWPKFVLVNDFAHNTTEKTRVNSTESIDWNLLGMQGNYNGSTPGTGLAGIQFGQSNWDTKVVGTRLPLTYFGPDGSWSEGTYEFPEGTKIGIFFIGRSNNRDNMIITSISKLNQDLYNETPHAASFQIGDKVVFAMEDMYCGGDKDVNDAMFIANGNFKKEFIPNIIPTVEPEGQTWIMACEDLGGSFDYDFNDLVFGLRVTDLDDNTSNLDLIPLAAGGTLDAKIEYNGTNFGEIHNLVKSGAPTTVPINVTPGQTAVKGQTVRLASGIPSSTNIKTIASQVKIIVTKGEATTNNNEGGTNKYNIGYKYNEENPDATDVAPQVLLLPAGWEWPSESKLITEIYPNFKNWVAEATDPESQTWVNIKADRATELVHNPLPVVKPSTDPENPNPGEGGGSQQPVTPGTDEWPITIIGEPVMGMNTTQTIEISIDGLSDYTNVECGTYSSNVITATKVDATHYTITGITNARGVARFYVKVPGDATHATTRKVFEITVGDAVPEFYFYTTVGSDKVKIDAGALTLDVVPTNANVNLGVEVVKGFGTSITLTSSDESVVKVEDGRLQRVGCGTTTITATHAAVDGSTNGSYSELSKSIQLTIAKLDPSFNIASEVTVEEEQIVQFYATDASTSNAISYTIEDETLATITTLNGANAIKGIKEGTTTIHVTMAGSDFYNSLTKDATVKVVASSLPEAQFTVTPMTLEVGLGQTAQFNTVNLIKGDINSLSYSIDKPELIELVNNNFGGAYNPTTVKGLALGKAHITITHGKTAQYKAHSEVITVNVVKALPTFTLQANGADVTSHEMAVGKTFNFTINETSVTSGVTYTCSSSDPEVASVSLSGTSGTITALKESSDPVIITVTHPATDEYSAKSQTIEVTVTAAPDYSQYGTEVTLDANNSVSKATLASIVAANSGKPLVVTVIGHVNQWASGNIKLQWNKNQGWGYQVVDVDGSYKQAAQTTAAEGETVILETTLTAEQYAYLHSDDVNGGLIVSTNMSDSIICVKAGS